MNRSHRTKLRRAIEHSGTLDAAIHRWADGEPCTIVHEADAETGKQSLRVRVHAQPTDPMIALALGDCIHNFRQSLDHIAYQLAIRVHGANPPPNWMTSEFPIMTLDSHQLDSELPKKIGPKKAMPKKLYTAIEGLQPYHGGDCELLAVLHELDNLDKHRFPPLVAACVSAADLRIGHLQGRVSPIRLGPIEDGAALIEFIPDPGSHVQMEANFTPSVAFAESSSVVAGAPVLLILQRIGGFIWERIFPELEPFLEN